MLQFYENKFPSVADAVSCNQLNEYNRSGFIACARCVGSQANGIEKTIKMSKTDTQIEKEEILKSLNFARFRTFNIFTLPHPR